MSEPTMINGFALKRKLWRRLGHCHSYGRRAIFPAPGSAVSGPSFTSLGWGYIFPGRSQCGPHFFLGRTFEQEAGGAVASPFPCGGNENLGIPARELTLLFRVELDHRPIFVWIAEGCENFPLHTEIGMVHVRLLGSI